MVVLSLLMLECSLASDLECSYANDKNDIYTCMTMNLKLKNTNSLITSIKGQHMSGKRLIDVEGLLVVRSNNKYLSSSIFEKIPYLKVLSVMYFSVEKIVEGNFNGAVNLKYIYINNNGITELGNNIFKGASKLLLIDLKVNGIHTVQGKTFAGLTTLEHINLNHNNLKTLPKEVFDDLINLKFLKILGNMLESLDGNLFKNNLNLVHILLSNNYLSIIGPNLLKSLTYLKYAGFFNNPCINAKFNDTVEIHVFNDKIASCTEFNKPEQKLINAESEKDVLTHKISLQNSKIKVLNQDVKVLLKNISTEANKTTKCHESNQQKLIELKYCQNETKFAFKCFH